MNTYEVSSRGDKRFSALFARMADGRTLEAHYQCDVKGYDVGGSNWRLGKGKSPAPGFECSPEELYSRYKQLWREWLLLGQGRRIILRDLVVTRGLTLTDRFARGPINQARALMELARE